MNYESLCLSTAYATVVTVLFKLFRSVVHARFAGPTRAASACLAMRHILRPCLYGLGGISRTSAVRISRDRCMCNVCFEDSCHAISSIRLTALSPVVVLCICVPECCSRARDYHS